MHVVYSVGSIANKEASSKTDSSLHSWNLSTTNCHWCHRHGRATQCTWFPIYVFFVRLLCDGFDASVKRTIVSWNHASCTVASSILVTNVLRKIANTRYDNYKQLSAYCIVKYHHMNSCSFLMYLLSSCIDRLKYFLILLVLTLLFESIYILFVVLVPV